jgi:purine-binding chemotaxis protein CheW
LDHGLHEVLVFELAGQRFGLPAIIVRELLRAVAITPIPRAPKLVEGVVNIRGQIVPVVDIRQWLLLPAKANEPADHLLVVNSGERLLALRVDRALELARLGAGAVDNVHDLPGARDQVAKLPDGLILLPDLETLLAQGELVQAQEISSVPEGPP